eukprot:m.71522 g.71522  ORF g.71522 m.71522 type:complete len:322 (+) comp12253_c0_seq1:289-1254(+)
MNTLSAIKAFLFLCFAVITNAKPVHLNEGKCVNRTVLGPTFDFMLLKEAALWSAMAYSEMPASCASKLIASAPTPVSFHVVNSTYLGIEIFAFLTTYHARNQIVLSFRGTQYYTQLVEELANAYHSQFTANTSLLVNHYFQNALATIYDHVRSLVAQAVAANPDYELFLTGHSLGAAMASLAALRFVYEGIVPPGKILQVTLGQPRVGIKAYAMDVECKIANAVRLTHYKDIVVHLPYENLNWYHHGEELWYLETMPDVNNTDKGHYTICETGEDSNCADKHDGSSLEDHIHYYTYKGKPLDLGEICNNILFHKHFNLTTL